MDNSFFEFRNENDSMDVSMASGHDSDVIDNSMMDDNSFTVYKKPGLINQATPGSAVVEESDESTEDEDTDDIDKVQHSSVTEIYSTDEDMSMTEINKPKRNNINQVTVITSSDEEGSPEMVPRKGPIRSNAYTTPNPTEPKMSTNEDSFTNLHANDLRQSNANFSIRQKSITSDKSYNSSKSFSNDSHRLSNDNIDKSRQSIIPQASDESVTAIRNSHYSDDSFKHSISNGNIDKFRQSIQEENCDESIIGQRKKKVMVLEDSDTSDGEDDEDDMIMSAATRMSIMGVRPKDMDSDESDFIQSDESHRRSSKGSIGSTASLTDLPEVNITQANPNNTMTHKIDLDISVEDIENSTKISCSPIQSPKQDLDATMKIMTPVKENIPKQSNSEVEDSTKIYCSPIQSPEQDLDSTMKTPAKESTPKFFSKKVEGSRSGSKGPLVNLTNRFYDDEVKLVETRHDVIDISSEDEDFPPKNNPGKLPVLPKMRSPKKEPVSDKENSIKPYLVAKVNPFQKVVYVKRHQRDNEVKKLGELRQEVSNIEHLMETMALNTLPDKGLKLKQRLTKLKTDVKTQEEKVAAMLIEPDNPTAEDIARDGFGGQPKGLSWDDIQAASNQVQPRMFGKQAMSTHIAERSLILQRLQSLHQSLDSRPAEGAKSAPPIAVKTPLMDHQLHALAWLQWRETQQPKGGILADDMGLGKTLTMISLVSKCKEKLDEDDDKDDWKGKQADDMGLGKTLTMISLVSKCKEKLDEDDDKDDWKGKQAIKGGTLVVCPASLLQQWSSEVTRYCPSLSVVTQHGAARATRPSALATRDLVLTTYHILQRDRQKDGVLMKIRWSRIILDEAHIVRNYKSATSDAVTALQGDSRWCLTGTPVQNKDLDVFALLKFLRCTPFDDLTMWKKWIDNKSEGGQQRLSTIMRCLLLRRTKQQLKEQGTLTCLPERTEHMVQVSLTKDEMNVYQKVLVFSKTLFAQFLHQRAEKQDMNGGFLPKPTGKNNDPYAKMHKKMVALQGANPVKSHEILVLLLRLRQLCCHCGLIAAMLDGVDTEGPDEDQGGLDLLSELKKMTLADTQAKGDILEEEEDEDDGPAVGTSVREAIRSVLSPNNPVFSLTRQSSKIKAVVDCLKDNVFVNKGEKAVVVSQWTSVLRLVEQELSRAHIRTVTLNGSVPVPKRAAVVDAFNTGTAQVILLSLCAGGVGLNLCGGNHLLLLDPHWNPQLEQQAQDRVYRVGQTRSVHVYRFMTVDTVEQSIRTLQEHKLQLAESVLTGARPNNASKLSIEDLKLLFNM